MGAGCLPNVWQRKIPAGEPLAWAVAQDSWHTLEIAARPDQAANLWAWEQARARTIAARRGKPFTLHMKIHPDHPAAHSLLAKTATLTYRCPHLLRWLNAPRLEPPLGAAPRQKRRCALCAVMPKPPMCWRTARRVVK